MSKRVFVHEGSSRCSIEDGYQVLNDDSNTIGVAQYVRDAYGNDGGIIEHCYVQPSDWHISFVMQHISRVVGHEDMFSFYDRFAGNRLRGLRDLVITTDWTLQPAHGETAIYHWGSRNVVLPQRGLIKRISSFKTPLLICWLTFTFRRSRANRIGHVPTKEFHAADILSASIALSRTQPINVMEW